MGAEQGFIRVEVAYALPERQILIAFDVPEGCTAREALLRSDIAEQVEGLDVAQAAVGVFGRRVDDPGSHTLSDGDRVEIYRPLRVDPMESRRRRAKGRRA
jgi:putative ubiquitin-RnfH superfamily antitoxin RatB of RatAB toxin-antitoxin module